MNKTLITTVLIAVAAGAVGAFAWNKYGKKKCACNEKKSVADATGNLPKDTATMPIDPKVTGSNVSSTLAADGFRKGH